MSANLTAPTAAWETRVTVSSALLPLSAAEVEDASGFWGVDPDAAAEGYSVTADGFEGVDPAALSGNTQRIVNGMEIIY